MTGSKRCTRCRDLKPLEEFSRHNKAPDGRQWMCKVCFAAYQRERKTRRVERPQAEAIYLKVLDDHIRIGVPMDSARAAAIGAVRKHAWRTLP